RLAHQFFPTRRSSDLATSSTRPLASVALAVCDTVAPAATAVVPAPVIVPPDHVHEPEAIDIRPAPDSVPVDMALDPDAVMVAPAGMETMPPDSMTPPS